jgi:hypothetical protein
MNTDNRGVKMLITGVPKIGKTSLLMTLPEEETLFIDLEAGDLAVQGWKGDVVSPQAWEELRDLACWFGGANPAFRPEQNYSQAHYQALVDSGEWSEIDNGNYKTLFIDSLSVAGRLCLQYAKGQPQAFSEKTGKPNLLGAYGLLGQELIGWATQLQHIHNINLVFVALLDQKLDEYNRPVWTLQIEGQKAGLEIPGIVDQVISMVEMPVTDENGKSTNEMVRAFVCTRPNYWGYPAGDRSGKLDMVERPHLGALIDKIKNGERKVNYEY